MKKQGHNSFLANVLCVVFATQALPCALAQDTPPPPPIAEPVAIEAPSNQAPVPDADKNYSTTSFSKQFTVYGKDAGLCSALATKVDEIRKDFFTLMKIPSNTPWKYKIGIKLHGSPGEPVPAKPIIPTISIPADKNAIEFTIHVHLGKGIQIDELSRNVVLMLLYEISLRNLDTQALPEKVELPPWLVYGIEQALLWKTNNLNKEVYASLFNRDGILSLDEILTQKNPEQELDAASFEAFKASCGALTMCLLSQNGGEASMMKVLDESIFGNDDPKNLIKRNFPLLTLTPTSLHKWWTLQLSTLAAPSATETLTIPETERRLVEVLTLIKYDDKTRTSTPVSFDKLADALSVPDYSSQLRSVNANLVYLNRQCFPTYVPIIVEYAKIITELQVKKVKPEILQKRIDNLVELRQLSVKAANRARDYLDWYEITERSHQSGSFDSYLNTMQMLRKPNTGSSTPISLYLSDIEKLHVMPTTVTNTRLTAPSKR